MQYNTGMESTAVDRENTWLSIQEAAEQLGVNPRTVRRYIRLNRLAVSRISNKVVRIRLADIDRFMETGVKPAPEVVVTPPAVEHAPRPVPQPAKPARFTPPGKFG